MRSSFVPVMLLALLVLLLGLDLQRSARVLPERVASHFDAGGRPNDWMARDNYIHLIGALGIGVPLFLCVLFFLARYVRASWINIPNREYWLAPERRAGAFASLFHHSLWLGCLFIALITGIHRTIVRANLITPPRLSLDQSLLLMGAFIAGIAIWCIAFWRRFRKPPAIA